MWTGGVRVIVIDDENRILMVKQKHQERTLWTVPGGQIEEGEDSRCAGIREVLEETGLHIEIKGLIWHVEEVGDRGQRFVNFFLAKPEVSFRGEAPKLGTDPEFGPDEQVLDDVRFMSAEELAALENVYPERLKDELWEKLADGSIEYDAFRRRDGLF